MRTLRRRTAREQVLADVPEKALLQQIIDAARLLGYLVYHTFDSRRSEPGFPDLVLVGTGTRAGRLIVIETKSETGRLTSEQLKWLGAFMLCPQVVTMVARPRDIDRVMEVLR